MFNPSFLNLWGQGLAQHALAWGRGLAQHALAQAFFFFAEKGFGPDLELFTFVINPGKSNDNAANHKPLGYGKGAAIFCWSWSRIRWWWWGLLFRIVVCDDDRSLSCGFFLLFTCSTRSFSDKLSSGHTLWVFFSRLWSWVCRLLCDIDRGMRCLGLSRGLLGGHCMLSKNNNAQKLLRISLQVLSSC